MQKIVTAGIPVPRLFMLQASKNRLAIIACIFGKSNYASTPSASPLLVGAEKFFKIATTKRYAFDIYK